MIGSSVMRVLICKPLDYIITGSSNCLREPLWQLRKLERLWETEGIGSSSA